ncbi:MAG TPA: alkaline phosphatase family protein [Gemmatimonadales bacterium]|nr:alkaline phosphatase family protein [Gemmatimonadales bacterium]
MRRCFLLLIDGLRPDVAERRLAAGELPHLRAMLNYGGRSTAVTGFPSTTSVAYLPFLTGCAPGRCDIPSIRWLDRAAYRGRWWRDSAAIRSYCGYQASMLDRDIRRDVHTVFELVPESLGIFTPVARGLTRARDPSRLERKVWGSVAHVAMWHQPSDDSVSRHLGRAVEGPWRFVFAQFPAVDGYTHQAGHDSSQVHRALRRIDGVVGCLRERLQLRGELDDSLILLVSDHGASPVHTHLDLADWFRARGIPTLAHPIVWARKPRAAVMVAGNGSAMVYAQPTQARAERWTIERLRHPDAFGSRHDIIAALTREPAVAFLAAAAEAGTIWVGSREGEALLHGNSDIIAYQPLSGDPLLLGGGWRGTSREWLENTRCSTYPDAPFHLRDQFRTRRSGDLLVVAREGYDFRGRFELPEHRSGHGSMIRVHMEIPVWSSQPIPDVPLRTVDLFPAMLHWLGVKAPSGIDGEPVWLPYPGSQAASIGSANHLARVHQIIGS